MIEVAHLTKRFGRLRAVDDLSFTVEQGQAVAFGGANGAGKTTVIRCLLNLIPYEGDITVSGIDVRRNGKQVRQTVGFVPQKLNFHDDLTIAETMTFYARLKKIETEHDFTPLLDRLDLSQHVAKPISDLSGGMKQRLALALALQADPPLLVLDEPTVNLDIRSRDTFIQLLLELKHVRQDDGFLVASAGRSDSTGGPGFCCLKQANWSSIPARPAGTTTRLGIDAASLSGSHSHPTGAGRAATARFAGCL